MASMIDRVSQIDELARSINANAGHLRIVLEQWNKEGILEKNKPGRDYEIRLTKKGEAIGIKLAELMDLDNNWEEPKSRSVTKKTNKEKKNGTTNSESDTV